MPHMASENRTPSSSPGTFRQCSQCLKSLCREAGAPGLRRGPESPESSLEVQMSAKQRCLNL